MPRQDPRDRAWPAAFGLLALNSGQLPNRLALYFLAHRLMAMLDHSRFRGIAICSLGFLSLATVESRNEHERQDTLVQSQDGYMKP